VIIIVFILFVVLEVKNNVSLRIVKVRKWTEF
jgi:hypothetical protein